MGNTPQKSNQQGSTTQEIRRPPPLPPPESLLIPPRTIFNELSSKPNDNEFSTFGEKLRDLQTKTAFFTNDTTNQYNKWYQINCHFGLECPGYSLGNFTDHLFSFGLFCREDFYKKNGRSEGDTDILEIFAQDEWDDIEEILDDIDKFDTGDLEDGGIFTIVDDGNSVRILLKGQLEQICYKMIYEEHWNKSDCNLFKSQFQYLRSIYRIFVYILSCSNYYDMDEEGEYLYSKPKIKPCIEILNMLIAFINTISDFSHLIYEKDYILRFITQFKTTLDKLYRDMDPGLSEMTTYDVETDVEIRSVWLSEELVVGSRHEFDTLFEEDAWKVWENSEPKKFDDSTFLENLIDEHHEEGGPAHFALVSGFFQQARFLSLAASHTFSQITDYLDIYTLFSSSQHNIVTINNSELDISLDFVEKADNLSPIDSREMEYSSRFITYLMKTTNDEIMRQYQDAHQLLTECIAVSGGSVRGMVVLEAPPEEKSHQWGPGKPSDSYSLTSTVESSTVPLRKGEMVYTKTVRDRGTNPSPYVVINPSTPGGKVALKSSSGVLRYLPRKEITRQPPSQTHQRKARLGATHDGYVDRRIDYLLKEHASAATTLAAEARNMKAAAAQSRWEQQQPQMRPQSIQQHPYAPLTPTPLPTPSLLPTPIPIPQPRVEKQQMYQQQPLPPPYPHPTPIPPLTSQTTELSAKEQADLNYALSLAGGGKRKGKRKKSKRKKRRKRKRSRRPKKRRHKKTIKKRRKKKKTRRKK